MVQGGYAVEDAKLYQVMNYLSVFSGIEAASVAWEPLGWNPVAFSEIEPFPCAVLAHHYPDVPNLGDITKFDQWPEELLAEVDLIIGGSPCQSFSIAGLRGGLSDARGNLALVFVLLINHIDNIRRKHGRRPVIVVWENVVGVLSDKTNAFGALVGALAGTNGSVATAAGSWPTCGVFWGEKRRVGYRVLDARYFGVAQRRRRVFLVATHNSFVADFGDGACPGEILSIADSLRGDPAPSRKKRKGVAGGVEIGPSGGSFTDLSPTLDARAKDGSIRNQIAPAVIEELNREVSDTVTSKWAKGSGRPSGNETGNMVLQPAYYSHHPADSRVESPKNLADAISARYGTGGGNVPIVAEPIAFKVRGGKEGGGKGYLASQDTAFTVSTLQDQTIAQPVAWSEELTPSIDIGPTIQRGGQGGRHDGVMTTDYVVRRLTVSECEILMGFPRNYTNIPWRNKPDSPDGPRYKALGNSMATPVVLWVGWRIASSLNHPPGRLD
jgi:DNA (cytosine-5)-methyltransferase 1